MRHTFLTLVVILAGCGGDSNVDPREEYWTRELTSFFQEDRTLMQLHTWLREHDVYYAFDPQEVDDGEWTVELERIILNQVVCESWFFFLDVTISDTGRIDSYSLEQTGNCL